MPPAAAAEIPIPDADDAVGDLGHLALIAQGRPDAGVRQGRFGRIRQTGHRHAVGHAQPVQHAVLDEGFPGHAADGLQHRPRHYEHQVAVVVVGSQPILDRHEGYLGQHLGSRPVGVWPEQQVARAQPEPRPVAEGIAHGDMLADVGVRQGEAGQIGPDRLVPLHLTLVDQHGQAGGGDVLGVGRDGKKGVLVNPPGLALRAHAITTRQHRRAVLDHRHAQSGLIGPGLHAACDIGVHLIG